MPENNERDDRLVSWKEIAAFLGVDERTCQRWEKRFGLPVQRIEDAVKSRVFARKADLEAWRASVFKNGLPPSDIRDSGFSGAPFRPHIKYWAWAAAGIVALLAVVMALVLLSSVVRDRRPADFRIEGPDLVVTNRKGAELWRHDTRLESLIPERSYRLRFQNSKNAVTEDNVSIRTAVALVIRDIDGDGRAETLFTPHNADDTCLAVLEVFDDRGTLRWSFDIAAEVRAGGVDFPRDFVTGGIIVEDVNGDGRNEILINGHTRMSSPTRIVLLDLAGRVLGEYWNAGQVSDMICRDLDGDGVREIICAGQNNGRDRPCLFVLDPRRMRGASPPTGRLDFEDREPGSELFYVLLPLTPLEKRRNPGVAAVRTDVLESGHLNVWVDVDGALYEFDPDLTLAVPTLGHVFRRIYQDALAAGRIPGPLDFDALQAELRDGVRYYDGGTKTWVNRRAVSRPR